LNCRQAKAAEVQSDPSLATLGESVNSARDGKEVMTASVPEKALKCIFTGMGAALEAQVGPAMQQICASSNSSLTRN